MSKKGASKKQSLADIKSLIKTAPVEALKLVRDRRAREDRGFRDRLYAEIGLVLEICYAFDTDREKKIEFIDDEFWDKCGPKRPNVDHSLEQLILFAVRYYFRATRTEGLRYNRAYRYARVLRKYHKDGVAPGEVPDRLTADEGIEKVFAAAAKLTKSVVEEDPNETEEAAKRRKGGRTVPMANDDDEPAKNDEDDSGGSDEDDDFDNDSDGEENDNSGRDEDEKETDDASVTGETGEKKRRDPDLGDACFVLEMWCNREDLLHILGHGIGAGGNLSYRRISNKPNPEARYRKRFVVTTTYD